MEKIVVRCLNIFYGKHITTLWCDPTNHLATVWYRMTGLKCRNVLCHTKLLSLGPSSLQSCLTAGCSCRWWTWWWAAIGGSCLSVAAGRSLVELLQEPFARLTSHPFPVCTPLCPTDSAELERKIKNKNIETKQRFAVAFMNGVDTDQFYMPYRLLSLWINILEPQEGKGASEPEPQRNTQEHRGQRPTAPDNRGSHWKTRFGGSLFCDELLDVLV